MLSAVRHGCPLEFARLREREFGRLDAAGLAYLDYTGSALYGESQLRAHHELLRHRVFGNPHSESEPSIESLQVLDRARTRVLRFFGVDATTHDVVFTANTSAAIRLVAESYPFAPGRPLILSADNHNSVNGMREYARRAGAPVRILPLDAELRLGSDSGNRGPGLVAFPAQSNFSGVLHPLRLVGEAHARGFDVLLDAAAYVSSHALSLRECEADFTAISFYKLFGYPTGIGALIARRDALARLVRPAFAGGTVVYASVAADTYRLRDGHDGFEDGTPDFLGVAGLDAGFELLEGIGMENARRHVDALTELLLDRLRRLPRVRIHGPASMEARGGTVAFNVEGVPYAEVESHARRAGVALRGGCFCNPGAAEAALGLDPARLAQCLDALGGAFTPERLSRCAGTAVGAVRASVGIANDERDIRRAVDAIASF